MNSPGRGIAIGLVLAVALVPALGGRVPAQAGPPEATEQARRILQSAGVEGGLVVHVGCGDGRLTAALRADDRYLVQGLDRDEKDVRRARRHVESLGLGGRVSVRRWDGGALPYADGLVNLLVVESDAVADGEIMRVLAPRGVACVRQGGAWTKRTKPWPDEIDEWTHYLHGPGNNAVAQDTAVGPPRRIRWIGRPRFARSHDHLASLSALVSAGGRVFAIVDEGSTAFAAADPKWRLVARDAFSGVVLWKREVSPWEYHLRDFRSGPADLARRLVAVDDRVYATPGYGKPVSVLDAATGETIRTYEGTSGTQEILYEDGTLLLTLGERKEDWRAQEAKELVSKEGYHPPFERVTPPVHDRRVMAVDAGDGEVLWEKSGSLTDMLMPCTLAAADGRAYFETAEQVVCVDAATGGVEWTADRPVQRRRLAWSTPTLVVHDGVVYSADRRAEQTSGELLWIPSGGYHQYIRGEGRKGELIAFDAETGERLWSCPAYEGFNSPVDVMIAGGALWTGNFAWGGDPGITRGRDPKTGEVLRSRPRDQEFLPRIGHSRCHRAKATENYLLMGRRGVEFIDVQTGEMVANRWVRGMCQYGVMPANGLLYVPPHSCACCVSDLLKHGFTALAPAPDDGWTPPGPELEVGPAGGARPAEATGGGRAADSWPTYRHDAGRSAGTPAALPAELDTGWRTTLGGKLTGPVVADGRLLVAEVDAHRVHALDVETGRKLWSFTAGGRIDSPPAIDGGRAYFGSADGRVYCLRLEDGELVWRYRAAPHDRQIVADGQLESVWPVHGNVLVLEGAVYFAAGRDSYLDGGMALYRLDAATGRQLGVADLSVDEKRRNGGVAAAGHLPDVLVTDGESIFMRTRRFGLDLKERKGNVAHLFSSAGLLDDNWWHRTYWVIGTSMASGWGGWPRAGQRAPAGRLLVTDGSRVFGYGRNQYDIPGAHVGVDGDHVWGPVGNEQGRWTYYRLFAGSMDPRPPAEKRREAAGEGPAGRQWSRRVPVLARAMVLAGDTLFLAGAPDPVEEVPREPSRTNVLVEALAGRRGGLLLAVSATDGRTLGRLKLDSPPVFNGMAAVPGRLLLTTLDGSVVCMVPAR